MLGLTRLSDSAAQPACGVHSYNEEYRAIIPCPQCGAVNKLIEVPPGMTAECHTCGFDLYHERENWLGRACALVITGAVLFIVANTFPFLGLESSGQIQSTTLLSGVGSLIDRQEWLLGALVFGTIFLFPLFELSALSYILFFAVTDQRPKHLGKIMTFLFMSRPWSMMEIFLVGVLVTSVKLGTDATLVTGAGIFAFAALVITLIATHLEINRVRIWQWYRPNNCFVSQNTKSLVACPVCSAVMCKDIWRDVHRCLRCHTEIEPRIHNSVQKTVALLITATILYIPANLLPLTTITSLGKSQTTTIAGSVIELMRRDMWLIAAVVFVASIVVPVLKILIVAYLVWTARTGSRANIALRMKLYHLTEFVGRWSMIDVFVVTLLVALVQFGILANIEPGSATLCFAAVVVLTMLAVENFDPRLIWDSSDDQFRT